MFHLFVHIYIPVKNESKFIRYYHSKVSTTISITLEQMSVVDMTYLKIYQFHFAAQK